MGLDCARATRPPGSRAPLPHRRGDVSEPGDVTRVRAADELLGGPLHGLVCVAGIAPEVAFLETTPEVFDRVMAVNVRGPFLCGQQAARRMGHAGGGRIVNIASTASVQAWSLQAAYGASKGGVALLTENMASSSPRSGSRSTPSAPARSTRRWRSTCGQPGLAEHDLSRTPARPLGHAGRHRRRRALPAARRAVADGQMLYVDGGFLATGGPMLADLAGHVSIER